MKSSEKARLKTQFKIALQLCIEEHTKTGEAARIVQNEPQAPIITSGEWERLGQRLGQSCQFLRADSQREKDWPTEQWRIAGGGSEMCETLLKKAGTMLLKSPRVRATLPDSIIQEPDPLIRWLSYLKQLVHHRSDHHYDYVDEQGVTRFGGILGSIPQLAYSSSVVCEECSACEL